ncbi:MAG TPA: hypothetical protein VGE39_13555 [Prosthecobacter sp.]
MKRHALPYAASVLALAFALNASGQEARPAAEDAKAPAAEEGKPAETPPVVDPLFAVPAVELNGFGTDEPVIRADEPTRGVIHIPIADVKRMTAQHWEQFDCVSFKAKRWGKYEVRLTYTLRHASLGTQFRIAGQSLKKPLLASTKPKQVAYGQINIAEPGVVPFTLYIAATGAEAGFDIQDISLVPAPEGPMPAQAADGGVVLEAKSATTWSENMRYEPKAEKNCLGFWTSADDFAEWGFDVVKPGRYKVSVVHGCGGGNEGSEVAVKCAGQELKFTVKDTGGFQKWSEVAVGEIEIKEKGPQHLTVDPVTKKKSAVLDVSKVVLTPAG